MNRDDLPSVLCVDDEPRVVEGLALHLRRRYQVLTANGAQSALEILMDKGAQALIVSDMRMPGIDGGELLRRVQQLYPDMTRILLSGEPGRDAADSAIDEGQIFRYLTKPCPPDQLLAAVAAGVAHHRSLVAARRAKTR
jgi:DNA-binding NtrC family response regulator